MIIGKDFVVICTITYCTYWVGGTLTVPAIEDIFGIIVCSCIKKMIIRI